MIGDDREDPDIIEMRERMRSSSDRSRGRRDSGGRVRDVFSDVALGAAVVALALLALGALVSDACAASPRPADAQTARVLRTWCPSSDVMPRRHCVAWMRVAQCETGGQQRGVTSGSLRQIRWRYNGSSGFDGALQFSPRTWRASIGRVPSRSLTRAQWVERQRGRYRFAHAAPPAVQILAAEALRVRRDGGGLGHWPSCGGRW